ncbi:geranylgeranyl reductase family protein [Leptolyngbya ectocarpi]|uniref:geranylgeranyl reductase family protein n=1 Tax=Leptolyngbya ectocarpi TaxID=1202 RepID=UPI001D1406B1|nr:geranylgeranyl reductase family protein [Leptolyngbya ectocarpi]
MTSIYDCVVVGGGPAGATAAYHLAKQGHSVLILEKNKLPRYKPCGGGVCPKVAEWFDYDFEPVISQKVTQVRYTYNLEDEVISELSEPIWMVRRDEFDHYMVQQAQKQGAILQEETKATGIEFKDGCWHISTSAEPVVGRYLIAADGAKGPVAKWLGFKQRKTVMAGAIETEPRLPVHDGHIVHFEFGLLKNGYVWNFPKADGYSLGSGAFISAKRKSRDLVQPLADYSQQFGVDIEVESKHGHPIFLWDGDQTLHTTQAVLAGEAACVVDPFTAEGIRPSILSGLKASEAVHSALAGNSGALADYTQTMIQEWGSEMRWAARLAKAFYLAPKVGYRVGVKHPRGTQIMGDVFLGRLRYSDVVTRGLRRLSAGLLTA